MSKKHLYYYCLLNAKQLYQPLKGVVNVTEPSHFRGRGVLNKVLDREGSVTKSNSLPFYIPFWQKRYLFRIPSIDKWYPFHIPSLEIWIPLNYMNKLQNQIVFSTLFKKKESVSPLGLFTNQNDRFPYPFIYLNKWNNYLKTWKWYPIQEEPSHVGHYRDYPPPPRSL